MIQMVELHYTSKPQYDWLAIKTRAEEILEDELQWPDSREASSPLLLFHVNCLSTFSDGKLPLQTAIIQMDERSNAASYQDEIQQSWRFQDCEAALNQSQHSWLVTELMAGALEPEERARRFHGVLQATIELTQPLACVFKHSQQVVHPEDYLCALDKPLVQRPGLLNVRFFNITDSGGDMLMDTRGMEELGLPDLQCHFHDIEPNEVAGLLYNTAAYLFENGPVIESGHTIAGVLEDSKWECQFEDALIAPARSVLDLNPGFPFAAGNRQGG